MRKGGGIARLLTQLNNKDWVSAAIDRYYDRARPERWTHADPTIHPSSLGAVCSLEFELGLLGHKTRADGQGVRRMDNGTWVGKRWVETFQKMGVLVSFEEPARDTNPMISGSIDVILQNPQTGEKCVGEIKSMNDRNFRTLPAVKTDRKANMQGLYMKWRGYCLQLTTYMTIMKMPAFFLFENKDNQEFRVFWVEPTDEMRDEVWDHSKVPYQAQQAVIDGIMLRPPFDRKSSTCGRCYRKAVCFRLQDGDEDAWNTVKTQFKQLGKEMKSPEWPVFGPRPQSTEPSE